MSWPKALDLMPVRRVGGHRPARRPVPRHAARRGVNPPAVPGGAAPRVGRAPADPWAPVARDRRTAPLAPVAPVDPAMAAPGARDRRAAPLAPGAPMESGLQGAAGVPVAVAAASERTARAAGPRRAGVRVRVSGPANGATGATRPAPVGPAQVAPVGAPAAGARADRAARAIAPGGPVATTVADAAHAATTTGDARDGPTAALSHAGRANRSEHRAAAADRFPRLP